LGGGVEKRKARDPPVKWFERRGKKKPGQEKIGEEGGGGWRGKERVWKKAPESIVSEGRARKGAGQMSLEVSPEKHRKKGGKRLEEKKGSKTRKGDIGNKSWEFSCRERRGRNKS